ncbi:hypothetical protein AA0111_g5539 [Alternaria arborescens]|uniref:hypothetical protein n=1 Tax=Alternaria arborescens TaxID=156630 RepID=UPI001074C715|nr:hypothetical protein AA0111_g5539 [Alternaria arborescens]RYO30261.1 hypothetical protein AA0111_g5539 [Alternaria arborescens]
MPSFLRPNAQRCRDFLSHPDAYVVHIPTGDDLYFTLPFDLSSLHPMRPQELEALHEFLDTIQDEVAENLGNHTLENVLQAQSIIVRWLENVRCLGDLETHGWAAGLGFPIFDDYQHPVDFHWDWDVIKFEGLTSKYFELVHPASTRSVYHSIYRSSTEHASAPSNTPVNRRLYRGTDPDYMESESNKSFSTHVAASTNNNEISDFCDYFPDLDFAPPQDRVFQFESDSHRGTRSIRGQNVEVYPDRVSQTSRLDAETIEPTKIQQRTRQLTMATERYSPKPLHAWEDFYQRGLICYGLAAENSSLVPYADLYLLKLYKAMRDQGSSEIDSLKQVSNIKSTDPKSFPGRSVWRDHSRWGDEKFNHTFPNEPGYCTPLVTVKQTVPCFHPEKCAEECYISSEGCMKQIQDSGQGPERQVRFVQPPSDQEVEKSTFPGHATPKCAYNIQEPLGYHRSSMFHERNSLLPSGREWESMAGTEAAKKLSKSKRQERNQTHSDQELQSAFEEISIVSEPKEVKRCALQNTGQRAPHFRGHEQRTSSAQKTTAELKHDTQDMFHQASYHRCTVCGHSNASQTLPIQKPTRVFNWPKSTARPSIYQAYAEDSPEDSPGAESGSWRDV